MSQSVETANKPPMIHAAIIAIMRAVGPIAKDQRNESQKYNFRGIDAVYNACHPHFAEHGVYSTSEVVDAKHEVVKAGDKTLTRAVLRMRFTFHAADGSSVTTEVVGEGIDYGGDKASNKAMSAADKYAILQLLKIPTAMVDSDKVPHEAPPAKANAPKTQPRSDRATEQEFGAIKKLWWSRREDRGLEMSAELFAKWCEDSSLCATKDALALAAWSSAMVAEARKLINQEMPEAVA